MIFIGQWFFLRFDDSTSIKSDTSEHGLDILHTIFFLYNLSLKNPPVLYNLLGDIIQNDLLLDGVNYFFVLLDRVVIFTQISEISSIFQILLYLLYFCLHWDIWVIIILLIMSQIQAIISWGVGNTNIYKVSFEQVLLWKYAALHRQETVLDDEGVELTVHIWRIVHLVVILLADVLALWFISIAV